MLQASELHNELGKLRCFDRVLLRVEVNGEERFFVAECIDHNSDGELVIIAESEPVNV